MKKQTVFLWGGILGAIVTLFVLFSMGWAVTSGAARASGERQASQAIVDHLSPICVAQFGQDPNREERLKELKALDAWQRGTYVSETGWATMPGSEWSEAIVANECAKRLVALEKQRS